MMIWEAAVGFSEQFDYLTTEVAVQRCANEAAHSVARIDDNLQLARSNVDARPDVFLIDVNDVALGVLAFAGCECFGQRDVLDLSDLLAVNGAIAEADFESVLVGRVVASSYHHTAIDALCEERVVENRRVIHSDVEHIAPGLREAAN